MEGFCAKTHMHIDWFMQINPVGGSERALGGGVDLNVNQGWISLQHVGLGKAGG